MTPRDDETVSATTTMSAPAHAVFAVLADPSSHAAIDGTGWVRGAVDSQPITGSGQVFRVGMYHPDHPDGSYEMANEVLAFDPPRAISWRPGYLSTETGKLEFGGWVWRYDLTEVGPDESEVTLTYDWSAVGPEVRRRVPLPPFPPDHLARSLRNLASMVRG
jgi:hypothetical protein